MSKVNCVVKLINFNYLKRLICHIFQLLNFIIFPPFCFLFSPIHFNFYMRYQNNNNNSNWIQTSRLSLVILEFICKEIALLQRMEVKSKINSVCLCNSMKFLFYCSHIGGISPIITNNKHLRNDCSFTVSKKLLIYSYFLQLLIIVYMSVTYTSRYICGPTRLSNGVEW